jgi:GTP cyclohydrolase II
MTTQPQAHVIPRYTERKSPRDTGAFLPPARVRTRVVVPIRLADGRTAEPQIVTFNGLVDGREHLAVAFGQLRRDHGTLVRIHSECLTGDVLGSQRCDCGQQLAECLSTMHEEGGVLLYLRQEGRGIGLYNKLDAYRLQDSGMDTFAANRALNFADDERSYLVAAQILFALGIRNIELLSNNPDKARQLRAYGVVVRSRRLTGAYVTSDNIRYLKAKVSHSGHKINIG